MVFNFSLNTIVDAGATRFQLTVKQFKNWRFDLNIRKFILKPEKKISAKTWVSRKQTFQTKLITNIIWCNKSLSLVDWKLCF